MDVYLLSKNEEIIEITKRFAQGIKLVGHSDLMKQREILGSLNGIHVDCFIAADEVQKSIYNALGFSYPIVCYKEFEDTTYETAIDGYTPNVQYTGILLGMSHSQCGLDVNDIQNMTTYKMARPSMDLFLHLKYFDLLSKKESKTFLKVKDVIIEIPYYIFNYDLSRFSTFTKSKMKYFDYINDYHNFGNTAEEKRSIREYRYFYKIFSPLCEKNKSQINKLNLKKIIRRIYYMIKVIRNKDEVWSKVFKRTIDDNTSYFDELITLVKERCPKANIHILVMPFNPLFRWSHKKTIKKQKDIFYSIIRKYNLHVIDHFCLFKTIKWFDDHCHLNQQGRTKYSRIFKECLSTKFNIN